MGGSKDKAAKFSSLVPTDRTGECRKKIKNLELLLNTEKKPNIYLFNFGGSQNAQQAALRDYEVSILENACNQVQHRTTKVMVWIVLPA